MISKPIFLGLGLAILGVSIYNAYILTKFAQVGLDASSRVDSVVGAAQRLFR